MKKLIKKMVLFVVILLMTGCSLGDENKEIGEQQIKVRSDEHRGKSEKELLNIIENISGNQIEKHLYVDMDCDGTKELVGVYTNDSKYYVWYCSSEGDICKKVFVNDNNMDECELSVIENNDSIHIVFYTYRYAGTMKNSVIFELADGDMRAVFNDYGCVSQNDSGDILLNVEAYDRLYDAAAEVEMGHTYKDTYLFYDDGKYKEYGATIISEKEFNAFNNANKLKKEIELEYADYSIEYSYFKRKNGIIHVQCAITLEDGSIEYQYYTVRYDKDVIEITNIVKNSGKMDKYFSNLEVVY